MNPTIQPSTDRAEAPSTGLARLRKMSTTAGVGLGEYRAVNGLAVTALVLGVASWMSWLHPLLYLVPGAAVVFGLVAIWQIRRSQGTQGGIGLAATGLVLSLVLGGWSMAVDVGERAREQQYRAEIGRLISEFGQALAQGDYESAYALTAKNFQSEIDLPTFRSTMVAENDRMGGIRGASENQRARVTEDATGSAVAEAMLLLDIGREEPVRQLVLLVREPEGWRILEFSYWFPRRRDG